MKKQITKYQNFTPCYYSILYIMNTTNQNDSKDTLSKHPIKNFVIGVFVILAFLIGHSLFAQVGVGNTNPQAQLDISASNSASPTNLDGILIPRVTNLPVNTSMTVNQDGMLVFYDNTGEDGKGFYYWDDTANDWIKIEAGGKNTLDEAYDEGGAGAGRFIYANDGNVEITGSDGLRITKTDNATSSEALRVYANIDGNGNHAISNSLNGNAGTGTNRTAFAIDNYIRTLINHGTIYGLRNQFVLGNNTGNALFTGNIGVFNDFYSGTNSGFNIGVKNEFRLSSAIHYGMKNTNFMTTTGITYGMHNDFESNGSDDIYGSYNDFNTSGTSDLYGSYNSFTGSGSGNKYGSYISIPAGSGGDHYGIYSNVQNSSGYAGYFVGRTSLGASTINRYLMPANAGSPNQIMAIDGSNQVNFVDASTLFTDTNTTYDGTDFALSNQSVGAGQYVTGIDTSGNVIAGTDQDNQTIDTFNLSGTTLSLSLEDDGLAPETVDLSSLSTSDSDWLVNPSNATPTNNTDNIYTLGSVSIGNTTDDGDLNVYHSTANDGSVDYLFYNYLAGTSISDDKRMIHNQITATGTGDRTGLYNLMIGNGSGTYRGLQNYSYASVTGDIYGMQNTFTATGGGNHYGSYTSLSGTGEGTKYGTYNTISTSAGGTHYGIYTNVQKSNSYAAYLVGRTSLGSSLSNRYLMPSADGTNGQVIQTDGIGNLSWTTLSSTTASNGLTETANDIQLGGTLTQNTTITQGTRNLDINLNNTGDFAIQDNGSDVFFVEDSGDIGIGNSNPAYQLHITENIATETRAVYIDKDDNTTASTEGVYVAKTSSGSGRNHGFFANVNGTGNGNRYGIYTDINGTGTGQKYGIFNELDSNTSGSQYAVRNWVRSESGSNQFGVFNNMENANTADIYGVYNGMRVTNASNMYGVYNEFLTANTSSTLMAGVRTRFTNGTPGGDGFAGIYTDFDLNSNGTYYGVRNEYTASSTGSGTKYGTYNLISSSAGGTHYGTYNNVSTANGWAGYFLGRNYISDRLSIGETNNASAKLSINVNSAGGTGIKHIELKENAANDGARLNFSNSVETTNSWTVYGRADDTNADSRLNIYYSGSGNVIEIYGDETVEVTGQLGVNLSNPTYAIHLPNSATIGTGQGRANAWATYSDNRVKSNQQKLQNGISLINQMTPKTYFHHNGNIENGILDISEDGENTLGFIAQELYEVLPEAVQKPEDENKSLWSVNYDKIIPVTVKAIQELNSKIKNLEVENKALKEKLNKMAQLEARLASIEKHLNNNGTTNTISASTND